MLWCLEDGATTQSSGQFAGMPFLLCKTAKSLLVNPSTTGAIISNFVAVASVSASQHDLACFLLLFAPVLRWHIDKS